MHAFVAKPLDWFVIQLARRYLRRNQPCAPAAAAHAGGLAANSNLGILTSSHDLAAPPDFILDADGRFRFTSSVRTPVVQNNTAFGRLFPVSAAWAGHPTVVLLHGWNAEWCYLRMFPRLAEDLQRRQINTATIELPYHLQRRPRQGPVNDFISSDLERMMEATQQALADTQALCRWLQERGSPAVGLWGFSLGAWLTGLIAGMDQRLRFAVLTTPIVSMERAIRELPFCEPVRRGLGQRTVDLQPLNLTARQPLLPPRDTLLVESRHDLFAPAQTVEDLWRTWNQPEIWRLSHGHISLLMSRAVMRRTVHWIAGRVGM